MSETEKFQFEKALLSLEQTVHSLEEGHLELDESLKAFEKGIQLTRLCQKALDDAEQKVKILMENGELQAFPEKEEKKSRKKESINSKPVAPQL